MPRVDIDTLRREQNADDELERSFSTNPVKKAIQELFHNEFSGASYRKLSIDKMRDLAIDKLKEASIKPGPYSSAVFNMTAKIKKAKTYESILMTLNEYLFS
jgi:hypothetical protein